ncbi:MAG: TIGR00153 family protein [Deltaproteobacteria bacterium]|nr:TIGR00153 family protein [Deltaproteobacteria bacterium]MBW2447955.1 TIGR00153 family protein [Deltaproteobacteria bacterium]
MSLIGDLFGRSPVKPMQEHMKASVATARLVTPLIEAMIAGDAARIHECRQEIDTLEHEADRIKNEIRSNLPARMMLALERRDMLEILDAQDSIADTAQDIAELADQRTMTIPPSMAEVMTDLTRQVVGACDQAEKIINELDELVETGFRGREVTRVEQMIDELSRIETETDKLEERATRQIFALEGELGISTIFWWHMVEWIADIADYAERVGNRLRLLIAN